MAKNGSDRYSVTGDSLQAYLKKIEKIPLLTREEEVERARAYARARLAPARSLSSSSARS